MKKIFILLLCTILLTGCFSKEENEKKSEYNPYEGVVDLNGLDLFFLSINASDDYMNKTVTWSWSTTDLDECNRHKVDFKIVMFSWVNEDWLGPIYVDGENGCNFNGETQLENYEDYIRVYEFQWEGVIEIQYEIVLP